MSINLEQRCQCDGSPEYVLPGESETKSFTYPGTVSLTGAFMHAWCNGADAAATVLSGSLSVSGNILTLKTISNEVGGKEYVYVFGATCLGTIKVFYFRRVVAKETLR